jgi:hypothetical protein
MPPPGPPTLGNELLNCISNSSNESAQQQQARRLQRRAALQSEAAFSIRSGTEPDEWQPSENSNDAHRFLGVISAMRPRLFF